MGMALFLLTSITIWNTKVKGILIIGYIRFFFLQVRNI